ncbi:MAG: restriction endonuclease subunit S [Chloroflexota bacterium]
MWSPKESVQFDSQVKQFQPNDVLFGKLRPYLAKVTRLSEPGVCVGEFLVLRPKTSEVTPHFLEQLLRSSRVITEVTSWTFGAKMPRADWDIVGNLRVAFPPVSEQTAIARFLDYADRRIRRYIAAKKKLIALLNELKQAIINRAVTRGLDPTVRLKPSGVEWLGNVPEHWEVKRLKWVTRLQRGYDLPSDQRKEGTVPVVSSGGVIDTHNQARAFGPGVVMGRYGSTDAVFFLEEDFWPHNTALFVTDFNGNDPRWSYYLLRTISKADYASKSAVPGVDRKDLYEIRVAQPPLEEQTEVVRRVETQIAHLESAIACTRREVTLIREYRTRLIADVVTGKLDVREVAARLPDEASDALEEEAILVENGNEVEYLDTEAPTEEGYDE